MNPPKSTQAQPEKKPEMRAWRVKSKDNVAPQVLIWAYGKYTAENEYRIRFHLSDSRDLECEEVK